MLPRSVRATGNVALSTVYYKDGAISQHYCAFNGKGKLVRLEYKPGSVVITVTDRSGRRQVSKLKWK